MSLLMMHRISAIQERFDAQDEASSPRESLPAAASAGASAAHCHEHLRKSSHPSQSDEFEELPLAEDLNGSTGLS